MHFRGSLLALVSALAIAAVASLSIAAISSAGTASSAGEDTRAAAVQEEMAEAIEAVQAYSAAQREQAVDEANEALAELDNYIENLEARLARQWDQMSVAARERAQDLLARLKVQRAELAETLKELQASSSNAWEEIKQGVVKSYQAIRDALDEATEEF